jgi:hypothetical protein
MPAKHRLPRTQENSIESLVNGWNGTECKKKDSLVRGCGSTPTAQHSIALSSTESEERACGPERCAKIQEIAAKESSAKK